MGSPSPSRDVPILFKSRLEATKSCAQARYRFGKCGKGILARACPNFSSDPRSVLVTCIESDCLLFKPKTTSWVWVPRRLLPGTACLIQGSQLPEVSLACFVIVSKPCFPKLKLAQGLALNFQGFGAMEGVFKHDPQNL